MAQLVQRWLGFKPTERQLEALQRRYHSLDALETELCKILMSSDDRRYDWFMAWMKEHK